MSEDLFHLGVKGLIRNAQGDVLLLQVNPAKLSNERQPYWDLPGGRVQKGQTVSDTLQREIEEETGIKAISQVTEVGMVLSNIRIPVGDDSVGLILGVYSCEIASDSVIVISDEHSAYQWFGPQEAAQKLAVKYPQSFCATIAAI